MQFDFDSKSLFFIHNTKSTQYPDLAWVTCIDKIKNNTPPHHAVGSEFLLAMYSIRTELEHCGVFYPKYQALFLAFVDFAGFVRDHLSVDIACCSEQVLADPLCHPSFTFHSRFIPGSEAFVGCRSCLCLHVSTVSNLLCAARCPVVPKLTSVNFKNNLQGKHDWHGVDIYMESECLTCAFQMHFFPHILYI